MRYCAGRGVREYFLVCEECPRGRVDRDAQLQAERGLSVVRDIRPHVRPFAGCSWSHCGMRCGCSDSGRRNRDEQQNKPSRRRRPSMRPRRLRVDQCVRRSSHCRPSLRLSVIPWLSRLPELFRSRGIAMAYACLLRPYLVY